MDQFLSKDARRTATADPYTIYIDDDTGMVTVVE